MQQVPSPDLLGEEGAGGGIIECLRAGRSGTHCHAASATYRAMRHRLHHASQRQLELLVGPPRAHRSLQRRRTRPLPHRNRRRRRSRESVSIIAVTWQKRRSRLARILGVAVLDEYPLSECRSGTHKGDKVVAVDGSPPGRAGPQPKCTRLTTRPMAHQSSSSLSLLSLLALAGP